MKITTFITSLIFLCAGMCCPPEEDRIYESFEFKTPGLIEIQNEGNVFNQNDTLWVKTVIPNILFNEDGEEINLNELSGNAESGSTVLNLYLESNFNQPSPIVLSKDEIIAITGAADYQYDLVVTAIEINNQLKSEFGIILKEKGTYFLGAAYLQNSLSFYIDSSNYTHILIETNFTNQDSDKFQFSVE